MEVYNLQNVCCSHVFTRFSIIYSDACSEVLTRLVSLKCGDTTEMALLTSDILLTREYAVIATGS